jgi:hypothetical protein
MYLEKFGLDLLVNYCIKDKFNDEESFIDFHSDLKAALKGDAGAQCKAGQRWRDSELAYEWFLLPAEQGFPEGQRMVGECHTGDSECLEIILRRSCGTRRL